MDSEMILPVFSVMAVVFLVLSFIIVLRVKSIPNKLLLLGLLITVAAVGFGAFLPGMATAAVIMLILAVICILTGLICVFVTHIAGVIKSGNEKQPKT
jgi:hypothetical protein